MMGRRRAAASGGSSNSSSSAGTCVCAVVQLACGEGVERLVLERCNKFSGGCT